MEHVKLAHGMHLHGVQHAGVLRQLRVADTHKPRGVRCWVLAAGIALAVTFVFVGITLWLGLSAATKMATSALPPGDRDPFKDLRVAPPLPPHPPAHGPASAPGSGPAHGLHHRDRGAPPAQPAPAVHASKKRKGQVEKVQQPDATGGDVVAATPATSSTSTTTTTTSTSTTTTSTTTSTTAAPEVPEPEVMEVTGTQQPQQRHHEASLPREPLQSAVPPPQPPPTLHAALSPRRPPPPPPRAWSQPLPAEPPMGPWAPALDLRPPPETDPMLAEAASAPEWRHALGSLAADEPPQAVDEPFHYDGEAPEEAESPVFVFVQERLRALKDWLAASRAGQDWQDMVGAVNASLYRADPGPALRHLREMYYNTSLSAADGEVPLASLVYPTDPAVLSNATSLVSFGLLAFDLLLLRNVQLLARGEDGAAGQRAEQLMREPEVRALGALFMPPQEVQRMRQLAHQEDADDSSQQLAVRMRAGGDAAAGGSEEDSGEEVTLGAVVQEVTSFLSSGLRAVLNLGRAYRATVAGARRAASASDPGAQQRDGSVSPPKSPLDCLWTLYCRSLDKTAKLTGPYGFLAKLNGLGLRLLLGTVPVEQALDLLVREATVGWSGMNCGKLFPRCSAEDAVPVVLDTAMGRTPLV